MKRIVLTFGFLAGAVLSAMFLLTLPFQEQIGFDRGAIIGYTTMVLAFLLVFFGIRSYRDNVAKGPISFGRAFKVGILITLIASFCYVAMWEVVYFNVMPDFMDKYTAHVLEKAKASGASEAELQAKAQQMAEYVKMYQNPLINSAITFIEPFPVGLVMTLVSAGILSRKRRRTAPGGEGVLVGS